MSIATLKKKTQAKYNNSSVGQRQFSLNGTHRSQGYVGQTSLSRSLPRTLMNGPTIRGHGGCCGTYPIKHIVQSSVISQEDSRVVKSSVINTRGYLETEYMCVPGMSQRWLRMPCKPSKMNIVKPDNNTNNNTQHDYITRVAKQTLTATSAANSATCGHTVKKIGQSYGNRNCDVISSTDLCNITKSDQQSGIPMSQGLYILQLDSQCANIDISKNGIVRNRSTTPLPGGHSGIRV